MLTIICILLIAGGMKMAYDLGLDEGIKKGYSLGRRDEYAEPKRRQVFVD